MNPLVKALAAGLDSLSEAQEGEAKEEAEGSSKLADQGVQGVEGLLLAGGHGRRGEGQGHVGHVGYLVLVRCPHYGVLVVVTGNQTASQLGQAGLVGQVELVVLIPQVQEVSRSVAGGQRDVRDLLTLSWKNTANLGGETVGYTLSEAVTVIHVAGKFWGAIHSCSVGCHNPVALSIGICQEQKRHKETV